MKTILLIVFVSIARSEDWYVAKTVPQTLEAHAALKAHIKAETGYDVGLSSTTSVAGLAVESGRVRLIKQKAMTQAAVNAILAAIASFVP